MSETAVLFAEYLSIACIANYPADDLFSYPIIKCNASKSGEKIYHLPFDQQYDRIVIEQERGEFYAKTVKEAEEAGFRRAFRHRIESSS